MFTRKEGRMLEQLTVRDYDLGSSLPVFTHAGISSLALCEACHTTDCCVLLSAVVQQQKYSSSDAGELEVYVHDSVTMCSVQCIQCHVSQEVSISVHVDYSGGLWISIDADLVSVYYLYQQVCMDV